MKTDDLIRTLAADAPAARPVGQTLVMGLVPALVASLVAMAVVLGFRADLAVALMNPVSLMRIVLTVALAGSALRLVLMLARPFSFGFSGFWPIVAVVVVAAGLFLSALVTTPAGGLGMAVVGKTMVWCLLSIPALAILPTAAILLALRHGATTAPGLAGAVAGLAGGGAAAAVYALHCTEDSPLFYVTWYGLAILVVTLTSALIGSRMLRW